MVRRGVNIVTRLPAKVADSEKEPEVNIQEDNLSHNPISRIRKKPINDHLSHVGTIGYQNPSDVNQMKAPTPVTHRIRNQQTKRPNKLTSYVKNASPTTKLMLIGLFIYMVKKLIDNNIKNKFNKRAANRANLIY